MRNLSCALVTPVLVSGPALAACGGSFDAFVDGVRSEAVSLGIEATTAEAFLAGATQDGSVLAADRRHGVLQLPFTDFARRLISADRLDRL